MLQHLLVLQVFFLLSSLVRSEQSYNALTINGLGYNGGTWNGGTWNGGTWNGGTWNGGTWNGGTWNGRSYQGSKINGIEPNGGTWNGGTWNGRSYQGSKINGIEINGMSFSGVYFDGRDDSGHVVTGVLLTNVSDAMPEKLEGLPMVVLAGFTLKSLTEVLANASRADPSLAELMPYLVRCSLFPTDSWTVVYNGTTNTYTGEFGLAPSLVDIPLTYKAEEMLSSCLMAHVNFFGKHVYISTRNNPSMWAEMEEMNDFGVYEGAFFGNLFVNNSQFTCTGLQKELALEQSSDRALRVCTEDMKCFFKNVGKCEDVCQLSTPFYGYSACRGTDGVLYPAANVFLRTTATSEGGVSSVASLLFLVFLGLASLL